MDAPELSVVTVTYGRHDLLRRKAESLTAQTLPAGRFEWCVTANGDAGAASLLRDMRLPFALKLATLERNGPIAAGRNLAARGAAGAVLLLSDDDVLPGPTCLAEHLAAHAAAGAGPRSRDPVAAAAVVIGDLRLPDDLRSGSVREPFERTAGAAGRALWINATGANTSLPRGAFEAVGGYDEAFTGYGGEDSDLALRLFRRGARFLRRAGAWATHVGRVLGDTDKAYLAGRAGVRVWRKDGGLDAGLLLGVHPFSLALKRLVLGTPLRGLYDADTAAYERAYLRGAEDELRAVPQVAAPPGTAEHGEERT